MTIAKYTKPALIAGAMSLMASTAFAGDFATLDANGDGQVSFAEYSVIAKQNGKSTTLAAQEFTRMAQGDAVLTQDEFFLAEALADQPYALQTITVSEPMPYTPTDTIEAPLESQFEVIESFPAAVEVMTDPPVAEEVTTNDMVTEDDVTDMVAPDPVFTPEPVMTETPAQMDSEVAGEVIMSDDWAMETPVEEGLSDLPTGEIDVQPELDMPELEMDVPAIESPDIEQPEVDTEVTPELKTGDIY